MTKNCEQIITWECTNCLGIQYSMDELCIPFCEACETTEYQEIVLTDCETGEYL